MTRLDAATRPAGDGRTNLSGLAYDRLEELIVTCALPPGLFLSIRMFGLLDGWDDPALFDCNLLPHGCPCPARDRTC